MIKIGVTGSIASGKTTVAKMLSGRKYHFLMQTKQLGKFIKKIILKKNL